MQKSFMSRFKGMSFRHDQIPTVFFTHPTVAACLEAVSVLVDSTYDRRLWQLKLAHPLSSLVELTICRYPATTRYWSPEFYLSRLLSVTPHLRRLKLNIFCASRSVKRIFERCLHLNYVKVVLESPTRQNDSLVSSVAAIHYRLRFLLQEFVTQLSSIDLNRSICICVGSCLTKHICLSQSPHILASFENIISARKNVNFRWELCREDVESFMQTKSFCVGFVSSHVRLSINEGLQVCEMRHKSQIGNVHCPPVWKMQPVR